MLFLLHIRVNVAVGLMSFGLMSPSALCRDRPNVVRLNVVRVNVVRLNVAFGYMSFGLMSFGLLSFGVMSFGILSVYPVYIIDFNPTS